MTKAVNLTAAPPDARFAIAELETPDDLDGLRGSLDDLPDMPLAVVTNFGPLIVKVGGETDVAASQARAKPLIEAGFHCLPELYLRQDNGQPTGVTGEALDFEARRLGWPRVAGLVFGLFGGAVLEDYRPWMGWPWSAYLAESIL
jgi:hypothetical protein